jgi:hypothetical protein
MVMLQAYFFSFNKAKQNKAFKSKHNINCSITEELTFHSVALYSLALSLLQVFFSPYIFATLSSCTGNLTRVIDKDYTRLPKPTV